MAVSEHVTQSKRNSDRGCGFVTVQLVKGYCPKPCSHGFTMKYPPTEDILTGMEVKRVVIFIS